MKDFLSKFIDYKTPILIGALLVAIVAVGWIGLNKIESLSVDLNTANANIATLQVKQSSLQASLAGMRVYHATTNYNYSRLEGRLNKLDGTLSRMDVIAEKPGLVTRIAKRQNEELEARLACASGNVKFCL